MSSMRDADARRRVGPMVTEDEVPDLSLFEPEKNIVVKAAAGTGKTTALVGRMVALVREGLSPKDMAAITFTREASGEMRAKFKEGLRKTAGALDQDEKRIQSALREADECFIDTIHAFCTQILREYAESADVPPGFTVLEPEDEDELKRRVWNEHLRRSRGSKHEEALSEAGVDAADLYRFFSEWCGFCDLDVSTSLVEVPNMHPVLKRGQELVAEYYSIREDVRGRVNPDTAMRVMDRFVAQTKDGLPEHPSDQSSLLKVLEDLWDASEERGDVTLKRWKASSNGSKDLAKELRDERIPELYEDVESSLTSWKEYVYPSLAEFVRPAVQKFYEAGREYGTLTFQHLLLYTRDLLRDESEVRKTLQERYKTILVDEFQDTDPVQAEILFYLTGRHTEEEEWWRCDPEPGRLFVVGDGKQSIYRFRRADHRIFEEVGSLICDQPKGTVESFQTNFRSSPEVCDAVNTSFQRVMDGEGPQVSYGSLIPDEEPFDGDIGLAELAIDSVSENWASNIADISGEKIASFIKSICESSSWDPSLEDAFTDEPSYGDFMLLARTAKRFSQYTRHLSEADIPFTVAGGKSLATDVAVRALVDLLTVSLRPSDGEARAAYLAGLLVGLSDRELYQARHSLTTVSGDTVSLNRSYHPEDLQKGDAPEQLLQTVQSAYRLEKEVQRRLKHDPVSAVVDWLIEEGGLLAHAALDQKGDLEAGALLRIRHEIERMEAEGTQGWAVLEQLRAILQGDRDIEVMTHREGEEEVVRLMTVHQAKGLEAPVVFLVDPYDRNGGLSPTSHVNRPEEPGAGEPRLHLPVRRPTGPHHSERIGEPPGWPETEEVEGHHQRAEEERIAYVAATRAEQLLVVSRYRDRHGEVKKDPEKAPWWPLYRTLDERDAPTLEDLYESRSEGSLDFEEVPTPPDFDLWQESKAPTYRVVSVTERAKGTYDPLTTDGGHPTEDSEAFGSAVHELLEWAVHSRRASSGLERRRAVVKSLLKDAYPIFEQKDLERALGMLETFCKSSIWTDLEAAHAVHPEHTLTWSDDGTVVRGTIDLVYKTEAGWHIVDYKTDRVGDNGLPEALGDHKYADQVRQYADAWKNLTGEKVASASLWFADSADKVDVL